jgi:hypothetical protein
MSDPKQPTQMADPLDGCTAKLKRARSHLYVLQHSIQDRRDRGAYTLDRHFEREGPNRVRWTWEATNTIPFRMEWSVVVGEILYDMSSALDHLAYLLAEQWKPTKPARVLFPIFKKRRKFWAWGDKSAFREGSGAWRILNVRPEARLPIIELQPYQRGSEGASHPLWYFTNSAMRTSTGASTWSRHR